MKISIIIYALLIVGACKTNNSVQESTDPKIYTIQNENGLSAKVTNYGGIIMELHVPTKSKGIRDVVLGFDQIEDYYAPHPYFGAIIGRYGNRIANGQFELNGKLYKLPQNNNTNTLHGGINGFDKQIWNVVEHSKSQLILQHQSPDGSEGFPGNLSVIVTYTIIENDLRIDYKASSDKTTIVNLTNHSYFNLDGAGKGNILNHQLQIDADYFNAVDSILIPEGSPMSVENTPFDFRNGLSIGERIEDEHPQIGIGNGYDHNFVLNNFDGSLKKIGWAGSSDKEVTMEIHTTEPGIQLYSGNFLDIQNGKGGSKYGMRTGFCLETQHAPDSPNRSDFPSTVLKLGDVYESSTIYRFNNS